MSQEHDDDVVARETSDRIERLLGELRASVAPAAWTRIRELVSSLTSLYGEGFARTLEAFASDRPIDGAIRERLCDDALVASVLLLHGLHPVSLEDRVARAVERVKREVGAEVVGGKIDVTVQGPAALKVRVSGDWRSSPLGGLGLEAALRRALEEAAPDLEALEIEREGSFAAEPALRLVQLDLERSHRRAGEEAR